MEEKLVLICSDNMEGIFTAVYEGWLYGAKGGQVEICTREPESLELFCRYENIETDQDKAVKVARTIGSKLGEEAYEYICYALVSTHPGKATAVFWVLQKALAGGRCNRRIMEDLADANVNLVFKLHTKVWHEYHRFFGFLRFREIGGGVLFAQISPDNDILVMLGPHFADRFPNEQWMIYDEKRRKVLLHPRGEACTLHTDVELSQDYREELANKEEYEELWKAFCESVTVQERKNKRLQQQFVPLKFRTNMLEFH